MDSDSKRRLVSLEQLNSLLDFMREHPDLAKGLSRGRRGKLTSLKVWNTCAKILNAVDQGVVKDGKGWAKYWCDWKYRVRRHALEVKAARDSDRPPPEGLTPLSDIEETIISIIGDNLDGVVIKSDPDPLADMNSNDDVADCNGPENEATPIPSYARRSQKRKRRTFSNYASDEGGTSPPESKARLTGDEDEDAMSARFLRLQEKQLEASNAQNRELEKITFHIKRFADILESMSEAIVKKLTNT